MATSHPDRHEVQKDWTWFETIAGALAGNFEDPRLQEELDARVSALGPVVWELGPGAVEKNALAISPDGDAALLPVTQRIVAMAPTIPGWEFHPARRPRSPSLEFSFETTDGRIADIDAQAWRYLLFRLPDGRFDLVLEQMNLLNASDDDRYACAVLLLDGLLGEATRLLRFREVEPVAALPVEKEQKASSVTSLAAHLESFGRQP